MALCPNIGAWTISTVRMAKVAAATQNLALSAILFLYREVLEMPLPWLDGIERAKKPARLPTVLTEAEVGSVLARLDNVTDRVYAGAVIVNEANGRYFETAAARNALLALRWQAPF